MSTVTMCHFAGSEAPYCTVDWFLDQDVPASAQRPDVNKGVPWSRCRSGSVSSERWSHSAAPPNRPAQSGIEQALQLLALASLRNCMKFIKATELSRPTTHSLQPVASRGACLEAILAGAHAMDISLTRSGAISTHAQPPAQDDDLFGCSIIIQYLHQIEMRQHVMRHLML